MVVKQKEPPKKESVSSSSEPVSSLPLKPVPLTKPDLVRFPSKDPEMKPVPMKKLPADAGSAKRSSAVLEVTAPELKKKPPPILQASSEGESKPKPPPPLPPSPEFKGASGSKSASLGPLGPKGPPEALLQRERGAVASVDFRSKSTPPDGIPYKVHWNSI